MQSAYGDFDLKGGFNDANRVRAILLRRAYERATAEQKQEEEKNKAFFLALDAA